VRPDSGKYLHYYFYFLDARFGLIYLRVPTWAPFRLQFYCNGHNWLARELTAKGIGYTMADTRSFELTTGSAPRNWPTDYRPTGCIGPWIDMRSGVARCPMCSGTYHWSLMQVEYATDLAFRSTATLGPLYEQLIRQSVLSVKAEQVATFLGRHITPNRPGRSVRSSLPGSRGPA